MSDRFGIVANVLSDRVFRTGAKVWLNYCNGDAECPKAIGLSKSGRMIQKYTHYRRLNNFRAKWVPEHMRDRLVWCFTTKKEAEDLAKALESMWSQVLCKAPDGRILRDGISVGAMFKKLLERSKPNSANQKDGEG